MLNTQNKIIKTFNLLIPFYYVAIGIILLMNFFDYFSRGARIAFGSVILLYGIFRIYRIFSKAQETE